jgi:hypothetical protein
MKHMFGGDMWANRQQGGIQNMGLQPGPIPMAQAPTGQVPLVQGPYGLSGAGPGASRALPFKSIGQSQAQVPAPKEMEGECSDGSCQLPQPSNIRPNPNAIPIGSKADCPVCHSFGGRGTRR